MTWKRWVIVAILAILLVKAPHTFASNISQVWHSIGVFFAGLNLK